MSEYAHIESLDPLRTFRAALIKFHESVSVALDEAEAEVQRTDFWLKQEQPAYWKQQAATRAELYARAKSALKRKQLQTTGLNNRPSCVDELKELARAERALEEAQHKQAEVRRWSRQFEQEGFSYTAAAQRLRTAAQAGLPQALAQLDAMIEAIEAYGGLPQVQFQTSTSGAPAEELQLSQDFAGVSRQELSEAVAYARLRARTPTADQRDQLALLPAEVVASKEPAAASAGTWRHAVRWKELLDADQAPQPDDKVTIVVDALEQPGFYMERVRGARAGDSGWHVGELAGVPESAAKCTAMRIRDLLARRPGLARIIELPPGWLAVLRSETLEAVLDADDALRWYGARQPDAAGIMPVETLESGARDRAQPPNARAE